MTLNRLERSRFFSSREELFVLGVVRCTIAPPLQGKVKARKALVIFLVASFYPVFTVFYSYADL